MHTVPNDVWTPMESMIRKSATSGEKLKAIINNIAEITGGQLTNNWGWSFLKMIFPLVYLVFKKSDNERQTDYDGAGE